MHRSQLIEVLPPRYGVWELATNGSDGAGGDDYRPDLLPGKQKENEPTSPLITPSDGGKEARPQQRNRPG